MPAEQARLSLHVTCMVCMRAHCPTCTIQLPLCQLSPSSYEHCCCCCIFVPVPAIAKLSRQPETDVGWSRKVCFVSPPNHGDLHVQQQYLMIHTYIRIYVHIYICMYHILCLDIQQHNILLFMYKYHSVQQQQYRINNNFDVGILLYIISYSSSSSTYRGTLIQPVLIR